MFFSTHYILYFMLYYLLSETNYKLTLKFCFIILAEAFTGFKNYYIIHF